MLTNQSLRGLIWYYPEQHPAKHIIMMSARHHCDIRWGRFFTTTSAQNSVELLNIHCLNILSFIARLLLLVVILHRVSVKHMYSYMVLYNAHNYTIPTFYTKVLNEFIYSQCTRHKIGDFQNSQFPMTDPNIHFWHSRVRELDKTQLLSGSWWWYRWIECTARMRDLDEIQFREIH